MILIKHPLIWVQNCSFCHQKLFGHEKGTFTGASDRKRGRFERADGGALFLDEIGELSPEAQVKLLRVIKERCFERVGGTKTIEVDVRVIAATHRDLEKMVREGKFREDVGGRVKGKGGAAELLNMNPSTLRFRMKKLRIRSKGT